MGRWAGWIGAATGFCLVGCHGPSKISGDGVDTAIPAEARPTSGSDRAASGPPPRESPTHLNLRLGDDVVLELVLIPAGEFWMGSAEDEPGRDEDERRHREPINHSLYMGVYEVTQRQWEAVMDGNPSRFRGDPGLPVDSVSWDQAGAFCRRVSERTGRPVRLPTEAEWEYACRAGTRTAYAFGAALTPLDANVDWSVVGSTGEAFGGPAEQTVAVGRFGPNAWGLYDMHGNVNEWCAEVYARDYGARAPIGESGESSKAGSRVLRGGSWYDHPRRCRSAYRHGYKPGDREECIGFRIVVAMP
jgi:formylglycine-generating enzyme required for sulfatase activity